VSAAIFPYLLLALRPGRIHFDSANSESERVIYILIESGLISPVREEYASAMGKTLIAEVSESNYLKARFILNERGADGGKNDRLPAGNMSDRERRGVTTTVSGVSKGRSFITVCKKTDPETTAAVRQLSIEPVERVLSGINDPGIIFSRAPPAVRTKTGIQFFGTFMPSGIGVEGNAYLKYDNIRKDGGEENTAVVNPAAITIGEVLKGKRIDRLSEAGDMGYWIKKKLKPFCFFSPCRRIVSIPAVSHNLPSGNAAGNDFHPIIAGLIHELLMQMKPHISLADIDALNKMLSTTFVSLESDPDFLNGERGRYYAVLERSEGYKHLYLHPFFFAMDSMPFDRLRMAQLEILYEVLIVMLMKGITTPLFSSFEAGRFFGKHFFVDYPLFTNRRSEYLAAIKNKVNPDNLKGIVLYVCGGGDVSTAVKTTDFKTLIIVDRLPARDYDDGRDEYLLDPGNSVKPAVYTGKYIYLTDKLWNGFACSDPYCSLDIFGCSLVPIHYELESIQAEIVKEGMNYDNGGYEIEFRVNNGEMRRIIYFEVYDASENISIAALDDLIAEGIDYFLFKAAYGVCLPEEFRKKVIDNLRRVIISDETGAAQWKGYGLTEVSEDAIRDIEEKGEKWGYGRTVILSKRSSFDGGGQYPSKEAVLAELAARMAAGKESNPRALLNAYGRDVVLYYAAVKFSVELRQVSHRRRSYEGKKKICSTEEKEDKPVSQDYSAGTGKNPPGAHRNKSVSAANPIIERKVIKKSSLIFCRQNLYALAVSIGVSKPMPAPVTENIRKYLPETSTIAKNDYELILSALPEIIQLARLLGKTVKIVSNGGDRRFFIERETFEGTSIGIFFLLRTGNGNFQTLLKEFRRSHGNTVAVDLLYIRRKDGGNKQEADYKYLLARAKDTIIYYFISDCARSGGEQKAGKYAMASRNMKGIDAVFLEKLFLSRADRLGLSLEQYIRMLDDGMLAVDRDSYPGSTFMGEMLCYAESFKEREELRTRGTIDYPMSREFLRTEIILNTLKTIVRRALNETSPQSSPLVFRFFALGTEYSCHEMEEFARVMEDEIFPEFIDWESDKGSPAQPVVSSPEDIAKLLHMEFHLYDLRNKQLLLASRRVQQLKAAHAWLNNTAITVQYCNCMHPAILDDWDDSTTAVIFARNLFSRSATGVKYSSVYPEGSMFIHSCMRGLVNGGIFITDDETAERLLEVRDEYGPLGTMGLLYAESSDPRRLKTVYCSTAFIFYGGAHQQVPLPGWHRADNGTDNDRVAQDGASKKWKDGGYSRDRMIGLLVKIGYPREFITETLLHSIGCLYSEIDIGHHRDHLLACSQASRDVYYRQFFKELHSDLGSRRYLSHEDPRLLNTLLVRDLYRDDIFVLIRRYGENEESKNIMRANLYTCPVIAQVGYLVLDFLGLRVQTAYSPGHIFTFIPEQQDGVIFIVDFSLGIFYRLDLYRFYAKQGRDGLWGLKQEYKLNAPALHVLNKEYNEGRSRLKELEMLNLFYPYLEFFEEYGATPMILNNISLLLLGLNKRAEAAALIQKAANVFPLNTSIRLNQALLYLYSGRRADAFRQYEFVLQENPLCSEAFIARAEYHITANDIDSALSDYAAALAREPMNAEWLYRRGIVLWEEGGIPGAIDDLGMACSLNPALLDCLPFSVSSFPQGIKVFESASRNNSEDARTAFMLGDAYSELRMFDLALSAFDSVLNKAPDFAGAYYKKSLVLKSLGGREEEAVKNLAEAVRLKPELFDYLTEDERSELNRISKG